MGYIYIIKNITNNKIYVGQTRRTIQLRWLEHRTNKNRPLNLDIKKYGKDNFIFILTKEVANNELDKEEQFYINKYNSLKPNGYNILIGNHLNLTYLNSSKGGKSESGHNLQSLKCKERYSSNPKLVGQTIPRGISYWKGTKKGYDFEGFKVRLKGIKPKEFICSINSNKLLYKLEDAKNYLDSQI